MDTQPMPPTLDALIAAAMAHLEAFGGRVLPTLSMIGKIPLHKGGCLAAKANPQELSDPFMQQDAYGGGRYATGYGYYPAQDIVVIDRDEKNGKSGKADTAYVEQMIGCPLPATATVGSPSGGDHLYFRLPPGVVLPHQTYTGIVGRPIRDDSHKLLPTGVDIFAHHPTKSHWVAGPGTVTPKGPYVWLHKFPVAMLPQPWIDHIIAAKPPKQPRDPSKPRAERETVPLSYVTDVLALLDPASVLHVSHSRPHDTRHMIRAIIMEALVLDEAAGQEMPEEDKIELLREWTARNPTDIGEDFDRKMRMLLDGLDDDTIDRAGLGSLHKLAKENGYTGAPPSIALANAEVINRYSGRNHPPSASAAIGANAERPPVLLPTAPMDSAREMIRREFTVDAGRTLVRDQGEFHLWNGRSYVPVPKERMEARIYGFLDGAFRKDKDGSEKPFNPTKKHVDEVSHALAAQTHTPEGAEAPCWLDGRAGPDAKQLLAVSNGLLNLTTRELMPHTPAFFNANALDFAYEVAATRTNWDQFLSQVFPGDQPVINTLQEMFGLLLTGDTSHQKAFLIIGPPRSGKGTIGRILTSLLGSTNVCAPTLSSLGKDFGKATLIGKRAAIMPDVQLGGGTGMNAIAESFLSITGQDTINVERKHNVDWTGRLQTRFVMMANELPKIANASGALANRFIMLTTDETFLGREDAGLTDRLLCQLPGILNWAMDGLVRLRERGRFVQPQSSAEAMCEMEHLNSPVKQFLSEMCDVGSEFTVETKTLYAAYVQWADDNGHHAVTAAVLGRDLKAAIPRLGTPKVSTGGKQTRRYQGVGLRPAQPVAQPGDNVRYMRPGASSAAASPVPAAASPEDAINVPSGGFSAATAHASPAEQPTRAQLRTARIAELRQAGQSMATHPGVERTQ